MARAAATAAAKTTTNQSTKLALGRQLRSITKTYWKLNVVLFFAGRAAGRQLPSRFARRRQIVSQRSRARRPCDEPHRPKRWWARRYRAPAAGPIVRRQ